MSKKVIAGLTVGLALLTAAPAFAQTATDTASTTPGTPNTGAGGNATGNAMVLVLSGLIALGGATYLVRTKLTRA